MFDLKCLLPEAGCNLLTTFDDCISSKIQGDSKQGWSQDDGQRKLLMNFCHWCWWQCVQHTHTDQWLSFGLELVETMFAFLEPQINVVESSPKLCAQFAQFLSEMVPWFA